MHITTSNETWENGKRTWFKRDDCQFQFEHKEFYFLSIETGKYIKQKSGNLGPAFESLIPSTDEWIKNICIYAEWNDVVDSMTVSDRLNRHESEQTPGDSEGQRSLVCCVHGCQRVEQQQEWNTNTKCSVIKKIFFAICSNIDILGEH